MGKLTKAKAREILHDKKVHGKPLTDKQRRFFAAHAYKTGGAIQNQDMKKTRSYFNGGDINRGGTSPSQFDYQTRGATNANTTYPRGIDPASGRGILSRGSRGEEVKTLQQFLSNQGLYKGNVDGIYGPQTERAVLQYQKWYNQNAKTNRSGNLDRNGNFVIPDRIKEDGIVGNETRSALMWRKEPARPQKPKKEEDTFNPVGPAPVMEVPVDVHDKQWQDPLGEILTMANFIPWGGAFGTAARGALATPADEILIGAAAKTALEESAAVAARAATRTGSKVTKFIPRTNPVGKTPPGNPGPGRFTIPTTGGRIRTAYAEGGPLGPGDPPLQFLGRNENRNAPPPGAEYKNWWQRNMQGQGSSGWLNEDPSYVPTPDKKNPFMKVKDNIYYDPYNQKMIQRNPNGSYEPIHSTWYNKLPDYSGMTLSQKMEYNKVQREGGNLNRNWILRNRPGDGEIPNPNYPETQGNPLGSKFIVRLGDEAITLDPANHLKKYPFYDKASGYATGGQMYQPIGYPISPDEIRQQKWNDARQVRAERISGLGQFAMMGLGLATGAGLIPGVESGLGALMGGIKSLDQSAQDKLNANAKMRKYNELMKETTPGEGDMYGDASMMVASGGDLQLTSNSFQVKGNPGTTDGNVYARGNDLVKLDHNEIVKNDFVFSNKLGGKMSYADRAKKVELSTKKAEKQLAINPADEFAKKTIRLNEQKLGAIAGEQEAEARMKGLRNADGSTVQQKKYGGTIKGYYWGGDQTYQQGPGDPPKYTPYQGLFDTGSQEYWKKFWTAATPDMPQNYAVEPLSKPYEGIFSGPIPHAKTTPLPRESREQIRAKQRDADAWKMWGQAGWYYPPSDLVLTHLNDNYYLDDASHDVYQRRGADGKYSKVSSYRDFFLGKHLKQQAASPASTSAAPTTTTAPTTTSPATAATGAPKKATPAAATSNAAFYKKYPGAAPTANWPTAVNPAGIQSSIGNTLMGLPLAPLPTPQPGIPSLLHGQGMLMGVQSQNAQAGPPSITQFKKNIQAAIDAQNAANESQDNTKPGATWGDILQAITVGSKFAQLTPAEREFARYDTTPISKPVYDPAQALAENRRTFRAAQASVNVPSAAMDRAMRMNLYASKLGADQKVIDSYDKMNTQAMQTFEQRMSQQNQYNNQMDMVTRDINARNRAARKMSAQAAWDTLGEFGKAMNTKQTSVAALSLLSQLYPDVYSDLIGQMEGDMKSIKVKSSASVSTKK